ncbi:MAG TPA: hypothetical protein VGR54_06375 [Nitrosopumilaceae archaeon]|nr:hypothetical protein [Nitrosopumilaceae archaeon]
MDKFTIEKIAEKFFGQQHSNIMVRKVVSKGTTWIATVSTGMPPVVRQVRIDAVTGKVLGFE